MLQIGFIGNIDREIFHLADDCEIHEIKLVLYSLLSTEIIIK